jgi:hypothetical protein
MEMENLGAGLLITNKRTVPDETRDTVLGIIEEYGFLPNDVQDLSYEKCEKAIKEDFQEGECDEEIPLLDEELREEVPRNHLILI